MEYFIRIPRTDYHSIRPAALRRSRSSQFMSYPTRAQAVQMAAAGKAYKARAKAEGMRAEAASRAAEAAESAARQARLDRG